MNQDLGPVNSSSSKAILSWIVKYYSLPDLVTRDHQEALLLLGLDFCQISSQALTQGLALSPGDAL